MWVCRSAPRSLFFLLALHGVFGAIRANRRGRARIREAEEADRHTHTHIHTQGSTALFFLAIFSPLAPFSRLSFRLALLLACCPPRNAASPSCEWRPKTKPKAGMDHAPYAIAVIPSSLVPAPCVIMMIVILCVLAGAGECSTLFSPVAFLVLPVHGSDIFSRRVAHVSVTRAAALCALTRIIHRRLRAGCTSFFCVYANHGLRFTCVW